MSRFAKDEWIWVGIDSLGRVQYLDVQKAKPKARDAAGLRLLRAAGDAAESACMSFGNVPPFVAIGDNDFTITFGDEVKPWNTPDLKAPGLKGRGRRS